MSAEISPNGLYRYTLSRLWSDGPSVAWLMFNPSTADATNNDATIRKCIGFSQRWGYGRMVVINLYAIRSRNPKFVRAVADPIGPMNDYWIRTISTQSQEVVCAWGCGQHFPNENMRLRAVQREMLSDSWVEFSCLGLGKDGHPKHPLMLPYATPRKPFIFTPLLVRSSA